MMNSEEKEDGFTLIELVTVVAVLGILTAIAIMSYGAIQQTAKDRVTLAAAKDGYTVVKQAIVNGEFKVTDTIRLNQPGSPLESLNAQSDNILLQYVENTVDGVAGSCVIGLYLDKKPETPYDVLSPSNDPGWQDYSSLQLAGDSCPNI